MNIGDEIVLIETVLVIDDIGHDFLIAGTEGIITASHGNLLSVQTAKGIFDDIPLASARLRTEDKAA